MGFYVPDVERARPHTANCQDRCTENCIVLLMTLHLEEAWLNMEETSCDLTEHTQTQSAWKQTWCFISQTAKNNDIQCAGSPCML